MPEYSLHIHVVIFCIFQLQGYDYFILWDACLTVVCYYVRVHILHILVTFAD